MTPVADLAQFQAPATIARILREARTIVVVGVSTDPQKPSAYVARYLQQAGYRVIPVHPQADILLGERVYHSLDAITEPVDLVDVFRPAVECLDIAAAAIKLGAGALWLQSGIVNLAAGQLAAQAGLDVVMDRCTKIEHAALRLPPLVR